MNQLPDYRALIKEIILYKKWKYPEKAALPAIEFNYYSSQASGMIRAQVKAPIRFSPRLFDRTLILLVDKSGKPEFSGESDSLFQIGLLFGDESRLNEINAQVEKYRLEWPDRRGNASPFHFSKDEIKRKAAFEQYCLALKGISFLNFKVNKNKLIYTVDESLHKATLYFSVLLSALDFVHYSHGKIIIIASDRPKTFSDKLVYELRRRIQIRALEDMVLKPNTGCCLPEVSIIRKKSPELGLLDVTDYLIRIVGQADHSVLYKQECSTFDFADKLQDWDIFGTFYSNELLLPEGLLLSLLKRPRNLSSEADPIIDRLLQLPFLPTPIAEACARIRSSSNSSEYCYSVLWLSSLLGFELDYRCFALPLSEREYLVIKTMGASMKMLLDFGIQLRQNLIETNHLQELYSLKWKN